MRALVVLPPAPEWQKRANCRTTDPEVFYLEKGSSPRAAKRVCGRCEVKPDCLNHALEHDERYGVWGGLSENERKRLKRRANRTEAMAA